ncbi:MAG: hypothetical protein O7G85_00195 [Planctomycetota bacterium]|nr:hypothetical protein [Planctomycetota bacterium]
MIATAITSFVCAAPANAGFTTISSPSARGELSHTEILNGLYGGSFSSSDVNFTNGSITATRIHDFDNGDGHSGSLNLLSSSGSGMNDQVWTDGVSLMSAQAVYGDAGQSFGIFQGSDDPTSGYTGDSMLSINPFVGTHMTYGQVTLNSDWRWGRDGTSLQSSLEGENSGSLDHMVTYMITGAGLVDLGYDPNAVIWLLFWDDGSLEGSNRDFNDLVIQISAIGGQVIPLPAPILLASIGLFGMILTRKRFIRKVT